MMAHAFTAVTYNEPLVNDRPHKTVTERIHWDQYDPECRLGRQRNHGAAGALSGQEPHVMGKPNTLWTLGNQKIYMGTLGYNIQLSVLKTLLSPVVLV